MGAPRHVVRADVGDTIKVIAREPGGEVNSTPHSDDNHAVCRISLAGAVVAIDPRTGAIKVMYSNPSYNPNNPNACQKTPGCSELNRATQVYYAPGSTFKIVTATAAIDSKLYTPNSIINGDSPITVSGVPLANDGNQSWGPQTFTTAMTYCQVDSIARCRVGLRQATKGPADHQL